MTPIGGVGQIVLCWGTGADWTSGLRKCGPSTLGWASLEWIVQILGHMGHMYFFGGLERTGLLDLENVDRTNIGPSGPHVLFWGTGADWTSGLRKCGPSWSG